MVVLYSLPLEVRLPVRGGDLGTDSDPAWYRLGDEGLQVACWSLTVLRSCHDMCVGRGGGGFPELFSEC